MIASNFKQRNSCIKALFVLLTKNLNTISFWNMKWIPIETTKLDFIRSCYTLKALKTVHFMNNNKCPTFFFPLMLILLWRPHKNCYPKECWLKTVLNPYFLVWKKVFCVRLANKLRLLVFLHFCLDMLIIIVYSFLQLLQVSNPVQSLTSSNFYPAYFLFSIVTVIPSDSTCHPDASP